MVAGGIDDVQGESLQGGCRALPDRRYHRRLPHRPHPANVSLDCVDPLIAPKAKNPVWLRSPLDLGAAGRPVKAAALTSLGFGHVGALIVYAHPGVFEEAVAKQRGADAATAWRERAEQRLAAGHDR
ncbi:fatty acid synthase [Corynebacterium striatum]|nr:hypothetical protein [Corynebacterium striatum]STD34132.1 fatty acid synthase [Corynebacterium striatum]